MTIVFTGDLHIHNHLGNSQYIPESGKYLDYLLDYCLKHSIKNVVILGDIFNCNNVINHEALLLAMDKLHNFKDKDIDVIIVTGNHDLYKKDNIDKAMTKIFSRSFIVVEDYQAIPLGRNNICLHFKNYGSNIDASKFQLHKDKENILCSHIELNGFKMGGIVVKEALDPSVLNKFALVINGHHHEYEVKKNIIIPGNPYHKDFSDVGKEKGFVVFDCETKKHKFEKYDGITYIEIDAKDDIDLSQYENKVIRIKYDKDNVPEKKLQELKKKLSEHNMFVDTKSYSETETKEDEIIDIDLQSFDDSYKIYINKYHDTLDESKLLEKYNHIRALAKR